MSESDDLSTPADIPPDSKIEATLRQIVRLAIKQEENITVNLARSRAEEELGLESAFFKDTPAWKNKSKDIINDAVEDAESPAKPAPKAAGKAGTKRKSDEAQGQRKKSKTARVDDSQDIEAPVSKQSNQRDSKKNGKLLEIPSSEEESALSEPPEDTSQPHVAASKDEKIEDDESDFSSVIDDPPPKKKRQKKSTSPSVTKKSKPAKSEKAAKPTTKEGDKNISPDEEEIKRLQSWLLKCGVRKLWHRELAPFSTSKQKIAHLKGMLDDVGMTGRFSAEKAKQIKEARELKEELDEARKFNDQWGHEAEDGGGIEEEGIGTRRKESAKEKEADAIPAGRLKPKGLVDFGDSDAESD